MAGHATPGGSRIAVPQTTRWSLIVCAGDARDPRSAAALAELCALWRPAVLGFLRRRVDAARAEDLTQDFMLHFIERRLSARADPERGRFRAFLFAALTRWWITQERARRALKRGGGGHLSDIGPESEAVDAPPEAAFDRDWATCLVREALRALEAEAAGRGRSALFDAAAPFLLEEPEPGDYARVAAAQGLRTNTFAVAVARLRQRLQGRIRDLVADTTADAQEAETELRHLRKALRER